MRALILLLLPFLLLVTDTAAQNLDRFTFGGEIRQRSELDNRFTDQETSFFHLLRTRFNARVEATPDIDVFVQVQDSRLLGEGDPQRGRGTLDPEAGTIGLHQAYFQINNLFDVPLRLRVGRQQLILGNERLVGAVNWSNVGRTFDAGRLTYQGDLVEIDAFAARLADTFGQSDDSENFFGLYTTWALADRHELEVFTLVENDTEDVQMSPGTTANRLIRFTPGATLRGAEGAFSYEFEFALQRGRAAIPLRVSREALEGNFQSARLAYRAHAESNLTIEAGFTRLSGGDSGDEFSAFNTLFATNHKFYGFMDYFPALFTGRGLQNAFVVLSQNVSERVNLRLAAHNFRTDGETLFSNDFGIDPPLETGQALGQEIDLTVSYRAHDNATFSGGISTFFSSDLMESRIGDGTPVWGYLMTTIRF